MGLSAVLDVVTGVIFIFLIFSLLASGLQEAAARSLATRSKHLWRTLRQLLDGDQREATFSSRLVGAVFGLVREADKRPLVGNEVGTASPWAEQLYAHPLIAKLDDTQVLKRTRLSAVSSDDFSRTIIDLLIPDESQATVDKVAAKLQTLDDSVPFAQDLMVLAKQAAGDLDKFRAEIGTWFDNRMDMLSIAYRKRTRWWLFAIGIVVAVFFNVNAIGATEAFYRDDALRAAVNAQAQSLVESCNGDAGVDALCVETGANKAAAELDLPVWWNDTDFGTEAGDVTSWIGWIVAAAAIAQGGTFWFDTLSRISGLKKTVSR